MGDAARRRVVIAGGGFAGLETALVLEHALARRRDLDVMLVNRENFLLFTPMLHEVAASDLDLTDIVNPIRKLLHRVSFFHGSIERVDLPARQVHVSHGAERHPHVLGYDHLVLALGCVTRFHDIPGLERHALTLKSLADAMRLRDRLIGNLEQADFDCNAGERAPLLTVVVAGGGFAGVETAAAVHDFLHHVVRFYPNLRADMLRLVLVHSGTHLLPELGEALGDYARRRLAARGLEIVLGRRVAGAGAREVRLADGTIIPCATLVWTAGTAPHPLLAALPCSGAGGRVPVGATLESADWPGVWAVGDCASVPDLAGGGTCPPTAQHASRQGRTAARNILAALDGAPPRPFRHRSLGQLAAIGRRTGVARVLGVRFSGFLAWWLWRSLYLAKLPRLEKKVRVLLAWTLDVLFAKDLVHLGASEAPPSGPPPAGEGGAGRAAADLDPARSRPPESAP